MNSFLINLVLLSFFNAFFVMGVNGQIPTPQCDAASQKALASSTNGFSTNVFFPCYDLLRTTGLAASSACFSEKITGVTDTCRDDCLTSSALCVQESCADVCGEVKATSCVTCAETNCEAALSTCTGVTALSFQPCAGDLLCGKPSWVLPVVIAGSIVGGCVLLIGCCCLRSKLRSRDYDDDDSSMCCVLPACSCCCMDPETARQKEEARIVREQMERTDRVARLNAGRQAASGSSFGYAARGGGRMPGSARVGDDFGGGADNDMFEMSLPTAVHSGYPNDDIEAGGGDVAPVLREHAIRVSKLPTEFRKSFQVGLTPQQIFDMQTLHDMKSANEAASTLPKAVIASHKALKMMGVSEGDVQKPYSEPVQQRVERLAMVSVKQGFGVGGATAGLGHQIVDQFAVKRKAAEARAEEYHRREVEREEAKIRAEIKKENQEEKRKTLSMRASQKLTPEEVGRLSQVANARKSAKQAANRLKDFIKSTQAQGGETGSE